MSPRFAPMFVAIGLPMSLAFGPRPGDIAYLQRIGITAWIERQLHPGRIDSRGLDGRRAGFRTLGLDAETLFREYDQPAVQEGRERQRQKGGIRDCEIDARPGEQGASAAAAGTIFPGYGICQSRFRNGIRVA
jgi:hypothetical protein